MTLMKEAPGLFPGPGLPAGPGRPGVPAGTPARPPGLTGILVAGAHGGAGASTLAALLYREIRRSRPGNRVPVRDLASIPDGDPHRIAARTLLPGRAEGPLILVARGNADGARRAVVAVTALGCLGIRPAALAVIGDGAGPLPKAAASRLDLLSDRAGPVVAVPFTAALRAGADADTARLPARLSRAVARLADLAVPRPAGSRP